MKKWYYIKKDVEYSTDLKFFIENQVTYSINREGYPTLTVFSRLDGKVFHRGKNVLDTLNSKDIESEVPNIIAEVHKNLLEGKYYPDGKFID
jgi:hypothetical protein